jgi:hypothetical protein
MSARRTEPTQSLLRGAPYVNAASTDIRVRFAAVRALLQPPASTKNVTTIKRKAK